MKFTTTSPPPLPAPNPMANGLRAQDLSSRTLNWNAGVGSICGISLSAETPAINLHSYKFYFARAIRFEVRKALVKLEPTTCEIGWFPHKITSTASYEGFTLHIEAFFVNEEVIAVHYSIDSVTDIDLELAIYGTARNGTSTDTFFQFRGRVERREENAVIDQEIDISDYRHRPMGPCRSYTHHLLCLVEAPEQVDVLPDIIETEHPERTNLDEHLYATGINRSNYWLLKKSYAVRAGAKQGGHFFVGARWLGTASAATQDYRDLRQRIVNHKHRSLQAIEAELVEYWNDLLAKVPPLKEKYRTNTNYCRLYYKAWVCILQNISGSLVTARKTIRGPTAMVGKVCSTGFGPAQWETSLAGFLVSFIDADYGVRIIESVLNSVEVDGFIPEDLIFNRDIKLSSYEPLMLEYIYRRTGNMEFLERNYDNAYRQLVFHIKHPSFYYLDPPKSWSQVANYASLLALGRIAVVLGKSSEEIKALRDYAADVAGMLDFISAGKEWDAVVYTAIYEYWDEQRRREALQFIRKRLVPPAGHHFLYGAPDGLGGKRPVPDSFKMNGYFLFILALERLKDEELLDLVVDRTFTGLTANGDFWECYYVDGQPWGNGPMSLFGAFGWIWCVMDKER